MAEARQRREWERTSKIVATIAEVNRDPKRRSQPFTPDEFNPYAGDAAQHARPAPDDVSLRDIKRSLKAGGKQRKRK